jgi:hypothetical protein
LVAGGREADGDDRFELLARILLKGQRIDQHGAEFVRNGVRVALEVDAIFPDVPAPDASHYFFDGFGRLRLAHRCLHISL